MSTTSDLDRISTRQLNRLRRRTELVYAIKSDKNNEHHF
nr:MAG TPA: hypothetical protein [Caudoviricetes sp.]